MTNGPTLSAASTFSMFGFCCPFILIKRFYWKVNRMLELLDKTTFDSFFSIFYNIFGMHKLHQYWTYLLYNVLTQLFVEFP